MMMMFYLLSLFQSRLSKVLMGWKSERGEMATIGGETKRRKVAKSGLCAFLSAASNILHIVRIDTRMTYYPPVCASYKYSPWKISSCQLHRRQMYTETFFKGYKGGTRSELRSAGQTNKPFQTKKSHLGPLSVTHIQREASPFNTLGWNANNLKPLSILQSQKQQSTNGDFTSAPNFHKRKEKPALLEIFSLFAKMLHWYDCHCTAHGFIANSRGNKGSLATSCSCREWSRKPSGVSESSSGSQIIPGAGMICSVRTRRTVKEQNSAHTIQGEDCSQSPSCRTTDSSYRNCSTVEGNLIQRHD